MMQTWVLPLVSAGVPIEIAGGKGVNLARLAAHGFPVPPGFLVTTAAYRAYVDHNGLEAKVQRALDGLPAAAPPFGASAAAAPAALEAASRQIRDQFAAGVLPPDLATALGAAYAALGQPAVAVRSSATAEDLPELSFAGQQDTLLNVTGLQALLEAVVACWSSLWTARAIGYRLRNAIPHDNLALAVVVQRMVPAEAAGVIFTANPLDGRRTEMVIEGTLGLGEALVSGQVEPDEYRVEAATGLVLDRRLGAKSVSIRPRQGGGTQTQPEEAAHLQALPDPALADLCQLGRQVAELFEGPQDIEWAWAGGQIHLLQSRPITSLFPVPAGMAPEPLEVIFSFGAVQGLLGPMTPLGRDAVRAIFAGGGRLFGLDRTPESQTAVYVAAERLFVRITPVVRHRVGRRVVRAALGLVDPGVQQALVSLLDDPRLSITGGMTPRTARRILPFLLPAIAGLIRSLLRPESQRARLERLFAERLREIDVRCAQATTLAQRLALIEAILREAPGFLLPQFVPRFGAGMFSLNVLNRLAAGLPSGEHEVLAMTRGLPHNVTTEMDLALWRAAREIRTDAAALALMQEAEPEELAARYLAGRLPETAQSVVAAFLEVYGMRGVGEIDLGRPRWRQDPTPVMQALQSYLGIEEASQAPDVVFARGAVSAEEAIERLAEALRPTPHGWLKARLVRWAARRMRALAGLRESPKFWAVRVMDLVRTMLRDSGRSLVEAGILAHPDDLFFLNFSELRALAARQEEASASDGGSALDWQALVRERRQAYAREERRTQVPRLLLSDGQAFYEGVLAPAGTDDLLAGSPVSPGVVEGRVRVVLDPSEAPLAPGEILVCPGTDPSWTPLFLVAGGLVMEVGGLMTHGSVVAREYGIPAVVGVTQATERLRTGQRVRVDGTAGLVTILDGGQVAR